MTDTHVQRREAPTAGVRVRLGSVPPWKPFDRLTIDDFVRTPVWTHDPARVARDDRFDDSWVRPARAGDPLDDEVFVRATLLDRDGRPVPRCVLRMRAGARRGARPVPTALVAVGPYASTPIEDGTRLDGGTEALLRLTPISYEVDVKVGSTTWRAEGRITGRAFVEAGALRESDEEARRRALIEAALAKRLEEGPPSLAPRSAKPPSPKKAPEAAKKAAKKPAPKPAKKLAKKKR